jgi:hypothetical protein
MSELLRLLHASRDILFVFCKEMLEWIVYTHQFKKMIAFVHTVYVSRNDGPRLLECDAVSLGE